MIDTHTQVYAKASPLTDDEDEELTRYHTFVTLQVIHKLMTAQQWAGERYTTTYQCFTMAYTCLDGFDAWAVMWYVVYVPWEIPYHLECHGPSAFTDIPH